MRKKKTEIQTQRIHGILTWDAGSDRHGKALRHFRCPYCSGAGLSRKYDLERRHTISCGCVKIENYRRFQSCRAKQISGTRRLIAIDIYHRTRDAALTARACGMKKATVDFLIRDEYERLANSFSVDDLIGIAERARHSTRTTARAFRLSDGQLHIACVLAKQAQDSQKQAAIAAWNALPPATRQDVRSLAEHAHFGAAALCSGRKHGEIQESELVGFKTVRETRWIVDAIQTLKSDISAQLFGAYAERALIIWKQSFRRNSRRLERWRKERELGIQRRRRVRNRVGRTSWVPYIPSMSPSQITAALTLFATVPSPYCIA